MKNRIVKAKLVIGIQVIFLAALVTFSGMGAHSPVVAADAGGVASMLMLERQGLEIVKEEAAYKNFQNEAALAATVTQFEDNASSVQSVQIEGTDLTAVAVLTGSKSAEGKPIAFLAVIKDGKAQETLPGLTLVQNVGTNVSVYLPTEGIKSASDTTLQEQLAKASAAVAEKAPTAVTTAAPVATTAPVTTPTTAALTAIESPAATPMQLGAGVVTTSTTTGGKQASDTIAMGEVMMHNPANISDEQYAVAIYADELSKNAVLKQAIAEGRHGNKKLFLVHRGTAQSLDAMLQGVDRTKFAGEIVQDMPAADLAVQAAQQISGKGFAHLSVIAYDKADYDAWSGLGKQFNIETFVMVINETLAQCRVESDLTSQMVQEVIAYIQNRISA